MMQRAPSKRPSPGTALGLLALLVALAGTANAGSNHVIVRKGDIAKGAVTAKALAPGSVRAKALAPGAVGTRAIRPQSVTAATLAPGAVTAEALGPSAITSPALAPGSVYGAALGPAVVHSATLSDLDAVAENGTWTSSATAIALCGAGERLQTGGIVFNNPGNREVGILQSLPFESSGSGGGWVGQITSNSGGSAAAEVQAICLK
jgi:hypothetical protein